MEQLLLLYVVLLSATLIIISGKLFICAPLEIISVAAIRRKTVYTASCIRAMQAYIIALLLAVILSVVDCGSPPPPGNNASPVGTLTRTTYQGTVTYTCDSGYEVSTGVTMATCMASGTWGPVPTCSRM